MARPRTSSRFTMLRQGSRSLLLFLENLCHRSSDFISQAILTKFTQVFGMASPRTSSRFMILRQRSRSLLLFLEIFCHCSRDYFWSDFDETLHKCSVWQDIEQVRVSWCCIDGQCHLLYLENLCHRSSDFISRTILTKLYTSVQYGKISNEFAFHDAASKVTVTVIIFRKSLSSL
jgi:hypothetical protein